MIKIRLLFALVFCLIFTLLELPNLQDKLIYINTGEYGVSLFKIIVFLLIEITFFVCLMTTSLASPLFKWFMFVLFSFSTLLSDTYFQVSGWGIEYQDFLMLYRSKANFLDAFSMYKNVLFSSLQRLLFLFLLFFVYPKDYVKFFEQKSIYNTFNLYIFVSCFLCFYNLCIAAKLNYKQNTVDSVILWALLVVSLWRL